MPKRARSSIFRRVDIQVSVFTAVVAIISCSVMMVLFYNMTHHDMLNSLEERVYSIQSFVMDNMDARAFTDINGPEDMDTEIYRKAHGIFKNVQDVTGVMYLYSGKKAADGELVYVVDCIDPSEEDFRSPGSPIEEEIIPEMERALSGREVMPHSIKNTEWGKIFVSYLPVWDGDEVAGVIGVEFEAGHQFNTYSFLVVVTPFVAAAICMICAVVAKKLFRRISNPLYRDMYNTDYLTDLKSRNAFEIDVQNLSAGKGYEGVGFYVIDLNNLKQVNDTYGHDKGDIYLQMAAQSFRDAAGKEATVYRVGGDEFVLISTGDTAEGMEERSKSLRESFERNKPDWELPLSFSVGCTLFDSSVDSDPYSTYKRADAIMYEKKRKFHAGNP